MLTLPVVPGVRLPVNFLVEGIPTVFGVELNTFTDPGGAEINFTGPDHYNVVSINWGDGTPPDTTSGGVDETGVRPGSTVDQFVVFGSHLYGEEGTYPITEIIDHDGVQTTLTNTAQVSDRPVVQQFANLPASPDAGVAFTNAFAFFTDPVGAEPNSLFNSHYKVVSINWGDGTPPDTTSGAILYTGAAGSTTDLFKVSGNHTYANPGNFTITTIIDHEGVQTTLTTTAITVVPVTANIVNRVLTVQLAGQLPNTVVVDHSGSGSALINNVPFSDADYDSIRIIGAPGDETDTTILGNVKPVTVVGSSRADRASLFNLPRILGTVSFESYTGDIAVQDQGDNTNQPNVRLTATSLTGLASAAINFPAQGLDGLFISGGDGKNTYTVDGTPVSSNHSPTVLGTGNGDDTVNILATTANGLGGTALEVTTAGRGNHVVNVGNNGTLTGIEGIVLVDGAPASAHVNINDGADTTNHDGAAAPTVSVGDNGVQGLSPALISFQPSALAGLTVNGGNGNNTWNVGGTSGGAPGQNPITLNTGTLHDVVNVGLTDAADPVILNTGNTLNSDVVNIGSQGHVSSLGPVTINNTHGGSKVNIDDSLDLATHARVVLTGTSLTGLTPAPGAINFGPNAQAGLTISVGVGDNTYTVVNTPSSAMAGGGPVVLHTGNGFDTVNVLGTDATAPLTVDTGTGFHNGTRGNDVVNVGNNGTLAGINGTLTLINQVPFFPSSAHVNINDGADNADHPNVLLTDSFDPKTFPVDSSLTGLSPAPIKFTSISINPLTITVGNGHNTFTVNDTEVAGAPPTVLNTGNGNDTVNVQGTESGAPLTVNAGTGKGTINVGSAANTLDHIQGAVTVNGGPGGDTLNINDQGSTTPHTYNQTATTLDRSGAARITFTGIASANLHVNKGPVLGPKLTNLSFPRSIKVGDFGTLKGRLVDPVTHETLTLVVGWGDGSKPEKITPNRAPFTMHHRYQKAGGYTVQLVWSDSKGLSNSQDLSLTVTQGRGGVKRRPFLGAGSRVVTVAAPSTLSGRFFREPG